MRHLDGTMSKSLWVIFSVLISGCATPVSLTVPGIERSELIAVKDLRPETEKIRGIFSYVITSEAYGMYRIGDASTTPSATRLLQHRAFEKLGSNSQPLDISIYHLVVYRNLQSDLRRGAVGAAIGGAIGAAAAAGPAKDPSGVSSTLVDRAAFGSGAAEEYKRAFYSEKENPSGGSVYIIYIDTEIRGKRVFSRTLAPLRTKESSDA